MSLVDKIEKAKAWIEPLKTMSDEQLSINIKEAANEIGEALQRAHDALRWRSVADGIFPPESKETILNDDYEKSVAVLVKRKELPITVSWRYRWHTVGDRENGWLCEGEVTHWRPIED